MRRVRCCRARASSSCPVARTTSSCGRRRAAAGRGRRGAVRDALRYPALRPVRSRRRAARRAGDDRRRAGLAAVARRAAGRAADGDRRSRSPSSSAAASRTSARRSSSRAGSDGASASSDLERLLSPPQARAFRGASSCTTPRTRRWPRSRTASREPGARRDRPRGHGHRRRDRAARRPGGALAACDAATSERRRRGLAARGVGLTVWALALSSRQRSPARSRSSESRSCSTSPADRALPRLPDDDEGGRASRRARRSGRFVRSSRTSFARSARPARAGAWPRPARSPAGLRSRTRRRSLRGVARRGARIDEPVDALVVGVPWIGPHVPREPLNPITRRRSRSGWRCGSAGTRFRFAPDGTLVLVHPFTRAFAPSRRRRTPRCSRCLGDWSDRRAGRGRAGGGGRRAALAAYRAGARATAAPVRGLGRMRAALARLGRVVVAGCRDAVAARTLGFVPSHGIGSALEMAHGVAGGRPASGCCSRRPTCRCWSARRTARPRLSRAYEAMSATRTRTPPTKIATSARLNAWPVPDVVRDQAEPRAVDEVAHAASDEQTEPDEQQHRVLPLRRGTRRGDTAMIERTASGSAFPRARLRRRRRSGRARSSTSRSGRRPRPGRTSSGRPPSRPGRSRATAGARAGAQPAATRRGPLPPLPRVPPSDAQCQIPSQVANPFSSVESSRSDTSGSPAASPRRDTSCGPARSS